jgi:hypothetical protein
VIVDLTWFHGSRQVGRANPWTNLTHVGQEATIQLLAERPAEADTLQIGVRPWREEDGIVTITGGDVIWKR